MTRAYFGSSGDRPVPGYYAGDGSKSVGIFRPANGLWIIRGVTGAYFGSGSKSVTIGQEGYNEWLRAGQDLVITVRKPSDGRIIVFAPDDFSVSYDSEIDSGPALVQGGGLVQLAGNPGETFTVVATLYHLVIDSGDYNGGGLSDIAVFRPDNGLWAVQGLGRIYFRAVGNVPVTR